MSVHSSRNGERGQTIAIVAISLVVLTLAAGLGVDMGYLRYERRRAQMAADSAAIAAASQYEWCGGSATCMQPIGTTASTYNGFTNVVISSPPTFGAYTNSNYVGAVVTQTTPSFFMKILGPSASSYTISASAVAYPGPGVGCIYALNTLTMFGYGQDDAFVQSGQCLLLDSGALNVSSDSYAWDTGGGVYGGTPTGVATSDPNLYPAPVPGAAAGNPLSYLSPFRASGIGSCTAGVCTPGDYPNGITIVGDWTFQPGQYSVEGNGLNISGLGNQAVTGNGVTFSINNGGVLINGTAANPANYTGCPNLTYGVTVQLVAPSNGPNAGILFIGGPNLSGTSSSITLNNGDSCTIPGVTSPTSNWYPYTTSSYAWGVIDFPAGSLTLNGTGLFSTLLLSDPNPNNVTPPPVVGCSDTPRFTIVIAYDLTLQGTDNFGVGDCGSITAYTYPISFPDPIKDAVLVE
jgi:hypothetical protein